MSFSPLDEILRLVQSSDYDVVVFDTAPTGHTLKALNAPAAIRTFLLLRILTDESENRQYQRYF